MSVAVRKPHLAPQCHCTGCGACVDVCSVGAVSMVADTEGFWYPEVNAAVCTGCLKCQRVCPADDAQFDYGILPDDANSPKTFWVYQADASTCTRSSSGGVFNALARKVLEHGGIVFGAGFDERFAVQHMAAENLQELRNLQTSKYVQSDATGIYSRARNELNSGRQVLFTGTPCQAAALRTFLGKDYDNLLVVDLICHGVPSPGVWERYLDEMHGDSEGRRGIASINFRDKALGWNDYSMRVSYADDRKDYLQLAVEDSFERGFLASLFLRPVCHQCQYKTVQRCSDITLADYWGVELAHPELASQQGVSLVLAQSEKGLAALDEAAGMLNIGETDRARAVGMNSGATASVQPHAKRMEFFERYNAEEESLSSIVDDCLRLTIYEQAHKLARRAGSKAKRMLKGRR